MKCFTTLCVFFKSRLAKEKDKNIYKIHFQPKKYAIILGEDEIKINNCTNATFQPRQ